MPTSSPGQQQDTAIPIGDEVDPNVNRNSIGDDETVSNVVTRNYYPGRPFTHAAEARIRICVTIITTWLFMIISALFLICYVYVLEWDPATSDSIRVFDLDIAVNLMYVMFIIDIAAGIAVILSHKQIVKPFNYRIFWPAVGTLFLNEVYGAFIWLWVYTGEFPRTCARNSFYMGRHCINIQAIMMANPNSEGTLSVITCKCDYGQCLPECKNFRVIQNYFWTTYFLFLLRFLLLVLLLYRPMRKAVCECQWHCCEDPGGLEGRSGRVSQTPISLLRLLQNATTTDNCGNGHTFTCSSGNDEKTMHQKDRNMNIAESDNTQKVSAKPLTESQVHRIQPMRDVR